MEGIKQASLIALADLRACYYQQGILASPKKFSDFWARDTFWACFGLLEAGIDLDRVRDSIALFLHFQRNDGHVPRKICLGFNRIKYLGLHRTRKRFRPDYSNPIGLFPTVDAGLLLVIIFCRYFERTKDLCFYREHFPRILKCLSWYVTRGMIRNHLLHEQGLANWMDTVFKKGAVLYTNCLWYEAVRSIEQMQPASVDFLGKTPAASILQQIQTHYWLDHEGYFADVLQRNGKSDCTFDFAGNILALLFHISDQKQSKQVLSFINTLTASTMLHPVNAPRHPWWKINPLTLLANIQDYHNGTSWMWVECLYSAILHKNGLQDEAASHLEAISKLILKYRHVPEALALDGRLFDHRFWPAPLPFAWGAGLFLYASTKLEPLTIGQ